MLKQTLITLAAAALLAAPTAADAAVKSPAHPGGSPVVSKAAKRISKRLGATTVSGRGGARIVAVQVGSTGDGALNDDECGEYVNVLNDALAAVANARPPLEIDGHVSTPSDAQVQAQQDLDHVVDNVLDQGCFVVW
jgi:hypothetical protein